MKTFLFAAFVFLAPCAMAQTDSLASGVYACNKYPATQSNGRESRIILNGSTTDLSKLTIHTSSLGPGQTNHPLQAYTDREEIVIVKEGQLKVNVNDSSKTIGAGSIVLIVAGDKQQFQNTSDKPATYCVLTFASTSPVNVQRGKESGGSLIKDWNTLPVKQTEKGESRAVFDRPSSVFTRFEIHATTLKAGVESHPPHTHRAEEMMILLEGNVTLNVNSDKLKASACDVMLLRSNVPHNLVNTGEKPCTYYAIKWYN